MKRFLKQQKYQTSIWSASFDQLRSLASPSLKFIARWFQNYCFYCYTKNSRPNFHRETSFNFYLLQKRSHTAIFTIWSRLTRALMNEQQFRLAEMLLKGNLLLASCKHKLGSRRCWEDAWKGQRDQQHDFWNPFNWLVVVMYYVTWGSVKICVSYAIEFRIIDQKQNFHSSPFE